MHTLNGQGTKRRQEDSCECSGLKEEGRAEQWPWNVSWVSVLKASFGWVSKWCTKASFLSLTNAGVKKLLEPLVKGNEGV